MRNALTTAEHTGWIVARADAGIGAVDVHHGHWFPLVVLAISTPRTAYRRLVPKTTSVSSSGTRTRIDPITAVHPHCPYRGRTRYTDPSL